MALIFETVRVIKSNVVQAGKRRKARNEFSSYSDHELNELGFSCYQVRNLV